MPLAKRWCLIFSLCSGAVMGQGAPRDRISAPIMPGKTRTVRGSVHRLALPQFDRGLLDPETVLEDIILVFQPTAEQQAGLDTLLAQQQNPASAEYHNWLTPEEYGDRFGVSRSDLAKVEEWLRSEGMAVRETARGRNWICFRATARQVSSTLHATVHRYEVNGERHYAISTDPSVPEAIAGMVGGFLGLHDFVLKPVSRLAPEYTSGAQHYLAPEDFATIYDVAPLYKAGLDGTGTAIAIVGQSAMQLSDIRAFRSRFNLPANDPHPVLASGSDPGVTSTLGETNLDLEWAGAVAPGATLYYVYGNDPFSAIVKSINMNLAQVISISFGGCELEYNTPFYRTFFQQANAQGITVLAASGDSGAAACDFFGTEPQATRGLSVDFPANIPEVTAMGGTQFTDAAATYFSAANSPNFGSALSYIPETGWSDNGVGGILGSGGGASVIFGKPVWQAGPGIPNDGARDVPDIAFHAGYRAIAYLTTVQGQTHTAGGTSACGPVMAGVAALLNQYEVANGYQKQPGMGNINPQLYRLAQTVPSAFHDITTGGNMVPCAQGSPNCANGSFGYPAGPGYDQVTGLGTIDVNNLITQWNSASAGVVVTFTPIASTGTVNDAIPVTVTVAAATGNGIPTGTVDFSAGNLALGSTALTAGNGVATATFGVPAGLIGVGHVVVTAEYSGDGTFSSGGASGGVTVLAPAGVSGVALSTPPVVMPGTSNGQLVWRPALTLTNATGISAMVTGFSVDGAALTPLASYFPNATLAGNSTLTVQLQLTGLAAPATHILAVSGTDSTGLAWSRQAAVLFSPLATVAGFGVTAPFTYQDIGADPSCQWRVPVLVSEQNGFADLIMDLMVDGNSMADQIVPIFGTSRMEARSFLQGTMCFPSTTPVGQHPVVVATRRTSGTSFLTLAAPPPAPVLVTPSPANVLLSAAPGGSASATLSVHLSDETAAWGVQVFPANSTASWLTVPAGVFTGSGTLQLQASAAALSPGVYQAELGIGAQNAIPTLVPVTILFTVGGAEGMAITSVMNAFSNQPGGSPGMLMSILGTNLANSTVDSSASPQFQVGGVGVTVNGVAALILSVSPGMVNIQVPYTVGSGPAAIGVNHNGQVAGYQFTMSAALPGVMTDAQGNIAPAAPAGGAVTLHVTGAGDVSPAYPILYAAYPGVTATQTPFLPVTVTVGGVSATVNSAALASGLVSPLLVNFTVPAGLPPGVQPVVVSVGGAASPAANLAVQGQ